jgi:hypothetical protein
MSQENVVLERDRRDRQPYALINKELIRDSRISFAARGLIIYLETCKEEKDTTENIISTQNISKKKLLEILKEAKDAGYVFEEENKDDAWAEQYLKGSEDASKKTADDTIELLRESVVFVTKENE